MPGAVGRGEVKREQVAQLLPLPWLDAARPVIPLLIPDGRVARILGNCLDAKQLQEKVARLRPLGVGLAAVTANDTTLVAHPDPSREGRKEAETEADVLGKHLQPLIDAVRRGQPLSLALLGGAKALALKLLLGGVAVLLAGG